MKYIIFDIVTGLISRVYSGGTAEQAAMQPDDGESLIAVEDDVVVDDTHLVIDEALVLKPEMELSVSKASILADGVDESVISGIPENTSVSIDRQPQEIDGNTVEFSVDLEGVYNLIFRNTLYLDTAVTIEATA